MKSIRRDVTLHCTLAITIVLLFLGLGLYIIIRHVLRKQFDHGLLARLSSVVSNIDFDPPDHFHVEFDASNTLGWKVPSHPLYVQVWNTDGKVVFRSQSLAGFSLLFIRPQPGKIFFNSLQIPQTGHFREAITWLQIGQEGDSLGEDHRLGLSGGPKNPNDRKQQPKPQGREMYLLALARPMKRVDNALATLAVALIVSCSCAVAGAAGLLVMMVSFGFKPIRKIAARIESIGVTDLGDRLPTDYIPMEIQPVVQRLNALLARVQNAFLREKELTADMAHELRTPLAGIRATLELARNRPRSSDEYRQTLNKTLALAIQIQNIVGNLLTLARAESGQFTSEPSASRLDQLLERNLAEFSESLTARRVKLEQTAWSVVTIVAPPELIVLVIRNVLDNAVSYVNDGGTIRFSLLCREDAVRLEVANTGSRISSAHAVHVFERFWRGDAARTSGQHHSGLGLSIVKYVMEQLRGTATVETQFNGWFVIRLVFPATDAGSLGP